MTELQDKKIETLKKLPTSLGVSRSSIFLSVPGIKSTRSKFQRCCSVTCLNVIASIFVDVVPESISLVMVLLSL